MGGDCLKIKVQGELSKIRNKILIHDVDNIKMSEREIRRVKEYLR